jgi:hypothetical protein
LAVVRVLWLVGRRHENIQKFEQSYIILVVLALLEGVASYWSKKFEQIDD